jgi:heme exporter protein C
MLLAGASGVAIIVALGMVFLYAPREVTMGEVQRIFYFHVASAWIGFFAFFVTFLSGIGYLATDRRRWDIVGLSSVEVGLTFITMTVVTGALWAKPVWGTYWTWEPRLTISAVQLLIYVAYGMLRGSLDSSEQKARFGAVYGIVAFVTVPRRTIHPDILTGGEGMAVTPRMTQTLVVTIVAFTLLYTTLLRLRVSLEQARDELARLRLRLERRPYS